jgi:ribonuclease D
MPDPPTEAATPITTDHQLAELIDHIRERGRFAFDTEFVSEETFEPVLCLIQVATTDRLAVVDPLAIRDLTPFWDVVLDPKVEVVMHAAGEDLRICRMRTGEVPRNLFDVQIAAGLVGFSYPLSLVNLTYQTLRTSLAGSETRTDWRRRPLTAAQLRYALDDVRYLLEIEAMLREKLSERGRAEWAAEEFADFLDSIDSRAEEERWRRLPGLHHLNRRSLEMARRLSDWREETARRSNRPLRQTMRDDLLVAIAKRQPMTRRDLEALRDFNRPALISRGAEILDVIAEARAVPEEELPVPATRPEEGPGLSTVASLLSSALAFCCVQNGLSAGLVANVSDVKHLIRWRLDGFPEGKPPALMQGWRREICGEVLLDVLEGRRSVRVVDPASEVPIALDSIPPSPAIDG